MCEFLDNFNFENADDDALKMLIGSVTSFLMKAEGHLAKTKLNLSQDHSMEGDEEKDDEYVPNILEVHKVLDEALLEKLTGELTQLTYTPTGPNKPSVCLLGNERYAYSKATANLEPQPLAFTATREVLDLVNERLDTDYNSVLVNKYANKNVSLGWHQDNENTIDQTQSITTLSVGATRRFWLVDDDASRQEFLLEPNCALVMKPGLQTTHFHKLCVGRANMPAERGVRFSLTFRKLLPSASGQGSPANPTPEHAVDADHKDCLRVLVFGSSLTKGLKKDLLSKSGKNFGVFTNSGAHVHGIMKDVLREADKQNICRKCVDTVFFVCGGNDVENRRLLGFSQAYGKLLDYTGFIFPNADIKVVSLLPRRLRNKNHLNDMQRANDILSAICEERENCNFINIFSYFLADRRNFFKNDCKMFLNSKLFAKDCLHFNYKGNSVLGKVIIAVTYNPR
jgi:alkylated DNA repair dioxygenase AlkB